MADRKGARRMSEIPPKVLRALNRGELESANLVEWLAVDPVALLRAVLGTIRVGQKKKHLLANAERLLAQGIMARTRGIGAEFHSALHSQPNYAPIVSELTCHPSDTVRGWACFALAARENLSLAKRFEAVLPLAMDTHSGVRENAWISVRPHIIQDIAEAIACLRPWAQHENENVRRFAIEATRPRGVWCQHLPALKKNPKPGLRLVEQVMDDPARYVQNAAGNWLNDASKTSPETVSKFCQRWLRKSKSSNTKYIVRRGLRTISRGNDCRVEDAKI